MRRVLRAAVRAGVTLGLLLVLGGARVAQAEDGEVEALTLEQCLSLALEHHPAITIERERLLQAEEDSVVARAALLPKLTGSAYYNRLDPGRLNPAGFASTTAPTLFVEEAWAGLRLRQVVLDGSSWLTFRAAGQGVDAQRSGVTAVQAETRFAVTLAYTRLVEAQNMVTVAQEAVSRQAAFAALAEALFGAGKVARLDTLKAEAQKMDAERGLVAAREAAALAQALLRRSIGVAAGRPVHARGELRRVLDPTPREEAVLAEAVAQNPQLQRLAAQARQLDAAVWAARGQHLPELSLQGGYGYRLRDIGGGAGEYTAGVFLDVPLFSGLATGAQVKRAESRRRELEASRRVFEEQLQVDVREALTSWRVAVESARFADKSIEVNREALAAATSLYESGKATALDVLTAQADLARAEGALVQAFGDYAIAQARVARVTGIAAPKGREP